MSNEAEERLKEILEKDTPVMRRAAKDAFASGRHQLGKTREELKAPHKKGRPE